MKEVRYIYKNEAEELEKSKGGIDLPGEAGSSTRKIEGIEYKGEGGSSTRERGVGVPGREG